jgi:hypothetical protein
MQTTTLSTRTYRKTYHQQRLQFYATVLAWAEDHQAGRAEAFRYVNSRHPVLSGTFPTLNSFDLFISRNRQELTGLNVDSGSIPTVWEDALPTCRDQSFPEEGLSMSESRDGFSTNQECERDRDRFLRSMTEHYTTVAQSDQSFLKTCVRTWVRATFPRDSC